MNPRLLERISQEFPASDQDCVVQLLASYSGPESERVRWDILELGKGKVEKIRQYVQAAQTDYRDILYWAEYYEHDPFLRDRDPKQIIDDILAKWGKKG